MWSRSAQGLDYNHEAVWIAAHLHDWGAYAPWAQKGVDHVGALGQVADEYLTAHNCPADLKARILECIALHHKAGSERSLEATLLRDADGLDFLGVVGVLRDFSKNPRDLRAAVEQVKKRRRNCAAHAAAGSGASALAEKRLRDMDALLQQFEGDSFGCF